MGGVLGAVLRTVGGTVMFGAIPIGVALAITQGTLLGLAAGGGTFVIGMLVLGAGVPERRGPTRLEREMLDNYQQMRAPVTLSGEWQGLTLAEVWPADLTFFSTDLTITFPERSPMPAGTCTFQQIRWFEVTRVDIEPMSDGATSRIASAHGASWALLGSVDAEGMEGRYMFVLGGTPDAWLVVDRLRAANVEERSFPTVAEVEHAERHAAADAPGHDTQENQ